MFAKGLDLEKSLTALMARVDDYIWRETKFQDWVYVKRDAQASSQGSVHTVE